MTLHVAIVNRHPDDGIGGSELQCELLARGLAERGHHVTYVAIQAGVATRRRAAGKGPYALVPLEDSNGVDGGAVARAVERTGAEVVYWRHGREGLAAVVAGLAQAQRAVPVVLAVAHVDDVSRWPALPLGRGGLRDRAADLRHRVRHRRSWRAFRQVAAIAAQREDFLGRAPVLLQRHIPNVVDPATQPFAWPRPYVAWVANLKPRKRPEQLAPLAQALAPHGIDLLVAGDVQDPRYSHLTRHDPGLPNLHPLGPLAPAGAAGLIAGARCLAVTARPEGLSNAMIQAWWHGVPTVSLDYDPDGAIAGRGLGAVCGGDPVTFRAAVVVHAGTDAAARTAGGRARVYAQERFALERNVIMLETLLHEVVAR